MAIKGYNAFPKALAFLEHHHQITVWWWCSGGLTRTPVGRIWPLWREAFGAFCSSSRLDLGIWGDLLSIRLHWKITIMITMLPLLVDSATYYYYSLRIFLISISWLSFTGVCMTASLLQSLPVSRTLLSILSDLKNGMVWMVSTRPFIFKSPSPFIYTLVTVPRAPIIIGINVPFMFRIFFSSLVRSRYLSFYSLSSYFYSLVSRGCKVHNFASTLFLLLILNTESGLPVDLSKQMA